MPPPPRRRSVRWRPGMLAIVLGIATSAGCSDAGSDAEEPVAVATTFPPGSLPALLSIVPDRPGTRAAAIEFGSLATIRTWPRSATVDDESTRIDATVGERSLLAEPVATAPATELLALTGIDLRDVDATIRAGRGGGSTTVVAGTFDADAIVDAIGAWSDADTLTTTDRDGWRLVSIGGADPDPSHANAVREEGEPVHLAVRDDLLIWASSGSALDDALAAAAGTVPSLFEDEAVAAAVTAAVEASADGVAPAGTVAEVLVLDNAVVRPAAPAQVEWDALVYGQDLLDGDAAALVLSMHFEDDDNDAAEAAARLVTLLDEGASVSLGVPWSDVLADTSSVVGDSLLVATFTSERPDVLGALADGGELDLIAT